jgi:hypothetical protein
MFLIPIRNKDTGEEKNFFGPQEIADFLAGREDAQAWTGWEFIGTLPAPTPQGEESATDAPATTEQSETAPAESSTQPQATEGDGIVVVPPGDEQPAE